MAAEQVAADHYDHAQLLAARANAAAVRAWNQVDPDDIAASWAQQLPALTRTVTAAQTTAAAAADDYVTAALAEQGGRRATAAGTIQPDTFAGIASDGRPLASLLASPAYTTLQRIAVGVDVGPALASGRSALAMIVGTQVTDAGRVADGVSITGRTRIGYVRMLSTPSCSRCVILAGKHFRWNQGFARHPRCDCRHIPVPETVAGDKTTDPRAYFDSLSGRDQDLTFTPAGAQAIRDGADMNQVVNARRGMTAAGDRTFSGPRRGARPMPERIYELADGDRDTAIELLRQHDYLA